MLQGCEKFVQSYFHTTRGVQVYRNLNIISLKPRKVRENLFIKEDIRKGLWLRASPARRSGFNRDGMGRKNE